MDFGIRPASAAPDRPAFTVFCTRTVLVRAYNSAVDHGVFIVRVGGRHLENLLHTPLLAQRAPVRCVDKLFCCLIGLAADGQNPISTSRCNGTNLAAYDWVVRAGYVGCVPNARLTTFE
jgi:hypothetical protein